jgi:hypothetical protein
VLGSPTPQGADQQGTPTMQDWMENMSFTVKPAPSDHDEANRQSLDFKVKCTSLPKNNDVSCRHHRKYS